MDLTKSESLKETLENDLEPTESRSREEDYLYALINTKLDKMYRSAREGSMDKVSVYQEELNELYQVVDPVELDRII